MSLTLYQLAAFSEALEVPASQFLDDGSSEERFPLEGNAFISDPSNDVFKPYFGTFYTLMHSTSSFEEGWLSGKITFSPDNRRKRCVVAFYVNTGEKSRHNQPIWKKYEGILIISRRMRVSYVILANKHMGELDMIAFRHRDFFIKQMECRLGLALTVSAGESRYPAVERILLSRSPLSDEKAQEVIPLLKLEPMQESFVRKRDLIASGYGDLCRENDDADEYLSINESIIRKKNRWPSAREQAMMTTEIKRFSVADYVTMLTEKEDNCAYEILRYVDSGNPDKSDKSVDSANSGMP